ncbi:MAG: cytochrome b/b6 domain-containing protein [Hyphomonadaceae bacterium]|nr:cytochrome b/b6 domain-containing protein [Hyphomonadaceae bacterium]
MSAETGRVQVWDWTIRVFHWSLVIAVIGMWWTAEQGYMAWHKWLGAGLVGLLTYRLIWGMIGPKTARLGRLVTNLGQIVPYLSALRRGEHKKAFGHNPLGGLSVLALLGLLILQTMTGLFAIDVNGLASGWFGHTISFELGRSVADLHELSFDVLAILNGVHVLAILAYWVLLRANLTEAMITGTQARDDFDDSVQSMTAPITRISVALTIAVMAACAVIWFGR